MVRKCKNPSPIDYKEKGDYKLGDNSLEICNGRTKLSMIGESSSDAQVFSGVCIYKKGREIPVAIKITTSDFSKDLCTLLNPTLRAKKIVPKIYDYFRSGDRYILVIELLGMTLCRYILLHKNTNDYNNIVNDIVNKLKIYHDAGFIHGDLHCNNIMINDKIYLIDFDRISNDDSVKNDINTLLDSIYFIPLNIATDLYGYKSKEYKDVKQRVKLFGSLLEEKFVRVYGPDIIEDSSEEI